jgi:hypothetical protein
MAEFRKLRGNRVFLEMPDENETKLIVDENTKEALQYELARKLGKLRVYAAGDLITDISKGDLVLVDPEAFSKAKIIPISENLSVILVSQFDIAVVW